MSPIFATKKYVPFADVTVWSSGLKPNGVCLGFYEQSAACFPGKGKLLPSPAISGAIWETSSKLASLRRKSYAASDFLRFSAVSLLIPSFKKELVKPKTGSVVKATPARLVKAEGVSVLWKLQELSYWQAMLKQPFCTQKCYKSFLFALNDIGHNWCISVIFVLQILTLR